MFTIQIGDIQPFLPDAPVAIGLDTDAACLFASDEKTLSAAKPVTKI